MKPFVRIFIISDPSITNYFHVSRIPKHYFNSRVGGRGPRAPTLMAKFQWYPEVPITTRFMETHVTKCQNTPMGVIWPYIGDQRPNFEGNWRKWVNAISTDLNGRVICLNGGFRPCWVRWWHCYCDWRPTATFDCDETLLTVADNIM